jgi:uncharacterized protein YegJ (DUF2314 family)
MQRLRTLLKLLGCSLLGASCSQSEAPQTINNSQKRIQPAPDELVPIGSLMVEGITFEFAILPKPTNEPLTELKRILTEKTFDFRLADKIDEQNKEPTILARMENDPQNNYAPPSLSSLQYFGRGLTRQQADELQTTESVFLLNFSYTNDRVWDGMRSALELTEMLARSTGGLIWDEATREVFTPEVWHQKRIAEWAEDVPEVAKHTVIHAYKKDDFVRAITLGMSKFGLPDVVIENFSWSLNRNMGHIANMFAQTIAEGAVLTKPGEFDLDFRSIKNAQVREPQVSTLKPNATGIALLSVKKGTWEDGDPMNRLIELTFNRGLGPDDHAKQQQIVAEAFGWEDSAALVKQDDELEQASRRARKKLSALRAEFVRGLAPGEFIQVKAPFRTPDDSQEWMWVEISSWSGDKIIGLLKNEPLNIPNLHGGQIVEVSESKVYDYLRRHADGTTDGNETGRLIEKRSQ